MSDMVFVGRRNGNGPNVEITVDGEPLFNFYPHSEGMDWGYEGNGPRALAYSMLCEHYGAFKSNEARFYDKRQASTIERMFAAEVVEKFPREGFVYTGHELGMWLISHSALVQL